MDAPENEDASSKVKPKATKVASKKPRKKRGEGTIFWMADRQTYRALATVKMTVSDTGARKAIRVSGHGATEAKALEQLRLNVLKYKILDGDPNVDPEDLQPGASVQLKTTYSEYMYKWLYSGNVRESTRNGYEAKIRLHICGPDGLGDIPVRALSATRIKRLIEETLPNKTNADGKRTLGPDAIRACYFIIKKSLDDAVKDGTVPKNQALRINPPQRGIPLDEGVNKKKWNPEKLFMEIQGQPDEAMWMLAFIGLRQSERLGLTDDCLVGLSKNTNPRLEVKQTLLRSSAKHGCGAFLPAEQHWTCGNVKARDCPQMLGGRGLEIVNTTKTASSTRTIPLVHPLLGLLRKHLRAQQRLRLQPSFNPNPGDKMDKLLFTTKTGRPIKQQDDSIAWHALLKEAGIKIDMRGHLARHISATILASKGYTFEQISRIFGWSSSAAFAVYEHAGTEVSKVPMTYLTETITRRQIKKPTNSRTTTTPSALIPSSSSSQRTGLLEEFPPAP